MASVNISVRTNSELKEKAQNVLKNLGMDLSTAINVYLTQIVYRNGIPFNISLAETKTAKLGGWENKIFMSDDFNEPMEEFKEYME